MRSLTLLLLLSASWIGFAAGQCYVCLKNNVSCVNETSYALCGENSGAATDEIKHCDEGFVCTDRPEICSPKSNALEVAACSPSYIVEETCNACTVEWETDFACVSENEYVICNQLGRPIMDEKVQCDEEQVCNMRSVEKCVAKSMYKPSCANNIDELDPNSTTVNTITTEKPITDLTGKTTDFSVDPIPSTTTSNETLAGRTTYTLPTTTPTPHPLGTTTSEESVRGCYSCTQKWSKNFACLSENLYVFCDQSENNLPSRIMKCKDDFVCNIGFRDVCVFKSVHEPSCYTNSSTEDPDLDPLSTTVDLVSTTTATTETNTSTEDPDLDPLSTTVDMGSTTTATTETSKSTEDPDLEPLSTTVDLDSTTTGTTETEDPDLDPLSTTVDLDNTTTAMTEINGTDTTTITPTSTVVTTKKPDAKEQCAAHETLGMHRIDCFSYLSCSMNNRGGLESKEMTCPTSTYFNPETKICDLARPDGCPEVTDPITSTVDPLLQMCEDMGGHGKYPMDCHRYLTCTNVNGVISPKVSSCGVAYYHPNLFRCFMSRPNGC